MITETLILEFIALSFIFLLASIWSEENVRFGYVLVPLMTAFFWWAGFLPFAYLTTIIPLIIFMGVLSFMRSQLKNKWGFGGTSGGLLLKLMFFIIMLQLAIGYVNGMGVFTQNSQIAPNNTYTTFNVSSAQANYGTSSYDIGANPISVLTDGLKMAWMAFGVLWSMIASVLFIYPVLVSQFGIPASLSVVIQAGIYVIYGLEVFNMLFKPARLAEV